MTMLRVREIAVLLGVSEDTVRRWIERGSLPATTDPSGRTVVEGQAVADLARSRAAAPRDGVSGSSSARNRFTGLVTAVRADGVMAQVDLQCGPFRVVSLMSSEAVEELGLVPGSLATAVVKATTVVVEATDRAALA